MWTLKRLTLTGISRQLSCFYGSSKKGKVLAARYQQKQLFGAVINKDDFNENLIDVEDSTISFRKYTVVDANTSSEYHWLIQNHNLSQKRIKQFKSNETNNVSQIYQKKSTSNPLNYNSASNTTEPNDNENEPTNNNNNFNNLSPASRQSVILTAKNLLNEFIISNRNNKSINDINSLFDENSLRSIINYSIMNDKLSEHQLNEYLFDKRLPSISKVLQATMSDSARIALQRWKVAKIAELGEMGFNRYQQETLTMGKEFHLAIETYLIDGHEPSKDSLVSKLWQSLGTQLKELELNPVLVEKPIIHPDLKYKGIVDNVSYVNNKLCALEWKTSDKIKSSLISTYDAPIQLCAYIGALNVDPRYDIRLKTGYVVVAYKNGHTAHIFRLSESDIQKYWSIWLSRLQEYWIRYRDGTLPDPI